MGTKSERTRKGLSKKETILLSTLSAKQQNIITINDIEKELDTTYQNARKIASRLNKKGWLDRIESGKYLIIPLDAGEESIYTEHEFIIASNLVQEYYIAFLSALNFHQMTEQTPFTVFSATKTKKESKTIHSIPYHFVKLKDRKFFGFKEYAIESRSVNISDPEKTLVDCLDHLEYAGGIIQVVKGLRSHKNDLDLKKLVDYAIKIENGAVVKRLDFLLDSLNYDLPDSLRKRLKNNYTDSYSLLDNTRSNTGKYKNRWKLKININEEELLEEEY